MNRTAEPRDPRNGPVTLEAVPRVPAESTLTVVGGRWMSATPDARLHTFESPDGEVSEVAERIVSLVDGQRSVKDIVEVLTREFEVSVEEAQADTLAFITLLVEKQVLTV